MSRTIRHTFKGLPVKDGEPTSKCASTRRCTYCGPGVVAATKAKALREALSFDRYEVQA